MNAAVDLGLTTDRKILSQILIKGGFVVVYNRRSVSDSKVLIKIFGRETYARCSDESD
jgi:hypothetical protein